MHLALLVLLQLVALQEAVGLKTLPGEWSVVSHPFGARDKFQAVCFNNDVTNLGEIILIGGRESDSEADNNVFHFKNGKWEETPTSGNFPAVYAFAMEKIGNYIYAFGGVTGRTSSGEEIFSDNLYRLNTQQWLWDGPLSKFSFPPVRRMASWTHDDAVTAKS